MHRRFVVWTRREKLVTTCPEGCCRPKRAQPRRRFDRRGCLALPSPAAAAAGRADDDAGRRAMQAAHVQCAMRCFCCPRRHAVETTDGQLLVLTGYGYLPSSTYLDKSDSRSRKANGGSWHWHSVTQRDAGGDRQGRSRARGDGAVQSRVCPYCPVSAFACADTMPTLAESRNHRGLAKHGGGRTGSWKWTHRKHWKLASIEAVGLCMY
jgi:hypothetical protein